MLYKYINIDYFDALIDKGSIRVGTLDGYKSVEAGDMVNDSMEGSKRFSGAYATMNKETAEKSSSMSRIIGFGEGASLNMLCMDYCAIVEPNYFIFSVSNRYSEDVHKKWCEAEGYNACYKIDFPNTFFKRITQSLNRIVPVQYLGLYEVQYYNEKGGMDWFDPKESLPAFALKDHGEFGNQTEIRAVWKPLIAGDIEPKTLNDESLGGYVDLFRSI